MKTVCKLQPTLHVSSITQQQFSREQTKAHGNCAADPEHTLNSSCWVLSPRTSAQVTTVSSNTKQAAHTTVCRVVEF